MPDPPSTEPCANCGELIYHGTYGQREQGPVVGPLELVAGTPCWRHHLTGLSSCLTMATPQTATPQTGQSR